MEGLIATDWLKDYDPLFELFDEEMSAGQSFAQAQAASSCDYGFASDYYDTCAYHNYSAGSQYTGANQRPADELSLILGLDWMSGLELAPASNAASNSSNQAPSPSRSLSSSCASSASSSCAPSPPATSTSAGCPAITQCSSSLSAQPVVMAPAAPVSVPMVQPVLVEAPVADLNENNGRVVVSGAKLASGPLKQTANSNQQQRVFRIQLQNHSSALNAATNNIIGHHGVASGLVGSNLIGNISGSPNGISNTSLTLSTTTSSSALKRKKRSIRTKGTSLLAQPSPKSANSATNKNSNNNNSVNLLTPTNQSSYSSAATLTTTAAPLSTLLTISRTTSVASEPTLSQQVLPAVAMPTAATTTITITTPSATTNLSPLGINHRQTDHHYHNQRLQLHHNHHHQYQQCLKMTTNADSSCNDASRSQQINHQTTNLTSFVRNMRYCVQIEHAYSTLSAASC